MGSVLGGRELGAGGKAVGDEVVRVRLQDLQRLTGIAAFEQQPAEANRSPSLTRVELEGLSQRLLVVGVREPVGFRGDDLVEESLDPGRRDGADELGDNLPVLEGLDGGDARDLELLGDPWIAVGVDLRELDLAVPGVDRLLQGGTQRPARATPLGPEVDHHGHLLGALDDLLLKLLLGYVADH